MVLITASFGCSTQQPEKPTKPTAPSSMEEMPEVPTVPPKPPSAPTPPPADAAPLKKRPVAAPVQAKPGELVGPVVSFFGAARADGKPAKPTSVSKDGIPTYSSQVGSGFILVVEGKPGVGNREVGRRLYAHNEKDPTVRGDLEIISSHDLGNGTPEVCDRTRPNIGGIPATQPLSFDATQKISDAINDFACRFETFTESDFSCTMNERESYSFVDAETTTQFCLIVARAYSFPEGTTELRVRLRDIDGNPGPAKVIRIFRPKESPKPQE
jgi:hypothetical protein